MKIKEMKSQSFEKYNLSDWERTVEKTLKGKKSEELHTKTYETIELKPLYTSEDRSTKEDQLIRKNENDWYIAQEIIGNSLKEIEDKVESCLVNGQNCLSLSIQNQHMNKELEELCRKVVSSPLPLFIIEKNTVELFTSYLLSYSTEAKSEQGVQGVMASDIISNRLESGKLLAADSDDFQSWIDNITKVKQISPKIKTILIDSSPYHNAGSNAVQELAYGLMEGVQYIEWLTDSNWSVEEVAERMVFHFSISSQFFMEIAKLRAFKQLWATVLKAYGVSNLEDKIIISAETSKFSKSNLDSYVNVLRAGGEAFSAVLGGIDYLKVGQFNEFSGETNPLSERIARNTQHILKEESHLSKVADPGAGSYFIETLTEEIGKKAWDLFVQLDESGGVLHHLREGSIQREIEKVLKEKKKDLVTRKKAMIGTNIFANLEESLSIQAKQDTQNVSLDSYESITPLRTHRLSEAFEELRVKAEYLKNKQYSVTAGLICLGSLKDHKARADYISGVLASGGISVVKSSECHSQEDISTFIKNKRLDYYVICGTDEDYTSYVMDALQVVQEISPTSIVNIAGKPDGQKYLEWKEKGLSGSIYSGQDIFATLTNILNIWEGENHNE
ncbi:methylmalonyl-CoA mutase family protein [Bacillus seohaeanensis]|uniref:methylmalonyl-CoA mutase n=1 Tax=Bacillus seohaeanensis TaxID=284580 RepID=A0ABW5RLV3_9BACI